MLPDAALIQRPAIDFTTFLGLSHQMLGQSLSSAADASRRQLSDAERFLSCLSVMRGGQGELTPNLLTHVTFSVLIVADERDMLDILEVAAGMPFVHTETTARGVDVSIVTGTLAQWRDAVKSASTPSVEQAVRRCFNKVMKVFETAGLNVWNDMSRKQATDQTLLLEDKRR